MIKNVVAAAALLAAWALPVAGQDITLENEIVTLVFDGRGRIVSIKEKATGRNLAGDRPQSFAAVRLPGRSRVGSDRLEAFEGGRLFDFGFGAEGHVKVRVEPFDGGWTFRVAELAVPKAQGLYLGTVHCVPALMKYRGVKSNALSDDESAVCVRGYGLDDEMSFGGSSLWAGAIGDDAKKLAIGFAAGPKRGFMKQLQGMTIASGAPHTTAGGPWALDGEGARASYLNANVTEASLGDWIDLAERGGFGVLHFREHWYDCRGHYPVNTNDWPRGLASLKDAVAKVHGAGLLAGMHTLTGCIDPKDPWVASADNTNLMAWATYTLAEPLAADATEMTIEEPLVKWPHHDTVFTYSGNGNAIRIGTEIVQYTGVVSERPCRFTGLVRGAFGTKVAAHAKGDRAAWLKQRYIAFYPEVPSPLADGLVAAISNVYATCRFDQIYCDGLEGIGMPEQTGPRRYAEAWIRRQIIAACSADGRPVLNEDSCTGSRQSWWFHSRLGAWDSTCWAPKRFHDFHIGVMDRLQVRTGNFLGLQMGWWTPSFSPDYMRPYMFDDMEYYAAKNAGLDASMSIAGVEVSRRPLAFHLSRLMTVLGWYEHARRARAFDPEVVKIFGREGVETRLRQGADGVWTVTPFVERKHKFISSDPAQWRVKLNSPRAALRVHALYAGAGDDAAALRWMEPEDMAKLPVDTAGTNVALQLECGSDAERGGILRIRATNKGATSRGAWARVANEFEPFRDLKGHRVIRAWVKGDGSGAVLNFQITKPRVLGLAYSEHYVKLDFTGWKQVEMPVRERDADDYGKYIWPYHGYGEVFHRWLNFGQIGAFNLIMTEIPAGGVVDAAIADVRLVPSVRRQRRKLSLVVNGNEVPVPFEMASGDFAEFEDGVWTHYYPWGYPVARCAAGGEPQWRKDENEVACRAESATPGAAVRTELQLFDLGRSRPAFKARPAKGWGPFLAYEACDPFVYAPSVGLDKVPAVTTRPGERAKVEVCAYGPTTGARLTLGDETQVVPAIENERRVRLRFSQPITGSVPLSVDLSDPNSRLRLEFIKRY